MSLLQRISLVVLLASGLAACGQQPFSVQPPASAPQDNAAEYANDLLRQANEAPPQQRLELMLQAAEKLALSGDIEWAQSIVSNLPSTIAVTPDLGASYGRLALINSYIASGRGDFETAFEYLNDSALQQIESQLAQDQQQNLLEQRARVLFELARYSDSLAARVQLTELLNDDPLGQDLNRELIWQTLMLIPEAELGALREDAVSQELRGWYSLAAITKNNQNNLSEQLRQVESWSQAWPLHPASRNLPADLQLLRELVNNQPKQIAVLLPFSGKFASAGNALRDGLVAAFYQNQDLAPQIRYYNTDQQDINELYDRAVSDGAETIIGPLSKENIAELALRPELPVPTLALNTVDNPLGTVANLYQFGLGVEDEAAQTAERAWRDGHRRILVLAPANQWGDRSVEAFSAAWQAQGGDVLGDYRYSENEGYSKVLQQALRLDESHERAKSLRGLVGAIEFEPRRRKDIDAIFLVAQAIQARQIKPTLAFHYAGDVPVYATGQVFGGKPEPKMDQDMNGIRFSTLPWYFDRSSAERAAILKHAETKPNLLPLYALGIDSFYLYPRLRQLDVNASATFYGLTGALQMNEQGRIVRRQVWAEFQNGRIRQMRDGN